MALYLVIATLLVNVEASGRLKQAWNHGSIDFHGFHETAKSVAGEGRDQIYTRERHAFLYPPITALIYAPLGLLEFVDASRINFLLQMVAAVGIAALGRLWGASRWEQAAIVLALASFVPLHQSLEWGQMTATHTLLGGLALFAMERQRHAPGSWALTAMLVLKPSLLAAPLGLLTTRLEWRPILGIGLIVAVLFVVPFLFIGLDEVSGYLWFSNQVTRDAFRADAQATSPVIYMFNWNGLLARLAGGQPPVLPILFVDAITVVLAMKAVRQSSFRMGWLAMTAAMLLVTPHIHIYEWLVLFAPAVIAYLEQRSLALLAVLLFVHVTLVETALTWGRGFPPGLWPVGLFGLVLYVAFRAQADRLFYAALERAGWQRERAPA